MMRSFGNFVKRGISKVLLIAMLATPFAVGSCETDNIEKQDEPGKKPGTDNIKYKVVEPITLPAVYEGMTQEQVDAAVNNVLDQLVKQSQDIEDGYMQWAQSLSIDEWGWDTKNTFIGHVFDRQKLVRDAAEMEGYGVGSVTTWMKGGAYFGGMYPQGDTNLFYVRIGTLYCANLMAQLEHHGDKASGVRELFDSWCKRLAELGGEIITTPQQAIRELPASILAQIPDTYGPTELRQNLIRQYQDIGKFEGFGSNLILTLGRDVTIPSRTKTRTNIQKANGYAE